MDTSTSPNHLVTFHGSVESTVHALRIIHAAHRSLIPRVSRRLNDNERQFYIRSGSVFVFSVPESGIKRWTDGLFWTPSRIVDNFLIYRELKEKGPARTRAIRSSQASSSPFTTGVSRDYNQRYNEQPPVKAGGLVKKTISVNIEGTELHLVAYYTMEELNSGKLRKPTTCPKIMAPYMSPTLFCLPSFRVPPHVVMASHGPRLAGDTFDEEMKEEVKREASEPHLSPSISYSNYPPSSYGPVPVPIPVPPLPAIPYALTDYPNKNDFSLPWPTPGGQEEVYWENSSRSNTMSPTWKSPPLYSPMARTPHLGYNSSVSPIEVPMLWRRGDNDHDHDHYQHHHHQWSSPSEDGSSNSSSSSDETYGKYTAADSTTSPHTYHQVWHV